MVKTGCSAGTGGWKARQFWYRGHLLTKVRCCKNFAAAGRQRGAFLAADGARARAEARAILAGLEQTIAERQGAEWVAQGQRCPRCGQPRAYKGHHRIVLRTPFGKLRLDSPRLYPCPCESRELKGFSPLAELLPAAHLARTGVPGNQIRGLGALRIERPIAPGGPADRHHPQYHEPATAGAARGRAARKRAGQPAARPAGAGPPASAGDVTRTGGPGGRGPGRRLRSRRINPPEPKGGLRSSWASGSPPRANPPSASAS